MCLKDDVHDLVFGVRVHVCSDELSEDVAENASVHEVGNLWVSVQTALHLEGDSVGGRHCDALADGHLFAKVKGECFLTAEAKRLSVGSINVLERQDTHAEQV